jgi:sarcosine oxidase
LRRGAEIHGHEAVLSWHADATGVAVTTPVRTYRAAKVIFCGGAWSGNLLRDLGVPLIVTRQVLGWVWPRDPAPFAMGKLPIWMIDRPAGGTYYGFPMITLSPGLKVALHHPAQPVDPDHVERNVLPGDEETFRPCLREFLPSADGPLLALRVCLYTNSPDGHFILDHHPQHERVVLAAGFSGHGFKFATVIGEALADLAQSSRTKLPVDFLGLRRFAGHSSR